MDGGIDKDASLSECETPQMGGVISVSGEQRPEDGKVRTISALYTEELSWLGGKTSNFHAGGPCFVPYL